MSILDYAFARNALAAVVFLAVLSGVVGTYIVVRRIVFSAGGITHASFGGIGLAYWAGFDPTLGALLFAVATSLSINAASSRGGLRPDSAIAMLWSLGMAVGVIFLSLTPGYAPNLMGFMFGDILAVSTSDVIMSAIAAAVCVIATIVFYRPLLYTAFDPVYAQVAHWHPRVVSAIASVLIAVAISLSIKAVGIILVLSVFTIPQSIALSFAHSLPRVMLLSGVIALLGSTAGLLLSFAFDLPSGAVITALLALILLIVRLVKKH